MDVSYNKLWKMMIDKNVNKTWLKQQGIHAATIAKMGKGEYVSMETLVHICEIMDCDFGDIMTYIPDTKE